MKNVFSLFAKSGDKETDKIFLQGLIVSCVSILLCIVALCSMTFAWFNTNLSSTNNVIESATFDLDMLITDSEGNRIDLTDYGNGRFGCWLEQGKTYTASFSIVEGSTASKGYCDIHAVNLNHYPTAPISNDETVGNDTFTIKIVAEDDVRVIFIAKWGMSALETIEFDSTVTVGARGIVLPPPALPEADPELQ